MLDEVNGSLVVNDENITKVSKALSSPTRWTILKILKAEKLDVSRIADKVEQTEANISAQIKILEKAGLVLAKYEPGEHGVRKICKLACNGIIIQVGEKNGQSD